MRQQEGVESPWPESGLMRILYVCRGQLAPERYSLLVVDLCAEALEDQTSVGATSARGGGRLLASSRHVTCYHVRCIMYAAWVHGRRHVLDAEPQRARPDASAPFPPDVSRAELGPLTPGGDVRSRRTENLLEAVADLPYTQVTIKH